MVKDNPDRWGFDKKKAYKGDYLHEMVRYIDGRGSGQSAGTQHTFDVRRERAPFKTDSFLYFPSHMGFGKITNGLIQEKAKGG